MLLPNQQGSVIFKFLSLIREKIDTMKVLIALMIVSSVFSCIQSRKEVVSGAGTKGGDTVIDPTVPSHFEIDYNMGVKISSSIFPQGSKGIGVIRIFINTASKVERFEIISARINNGGNTIYNYASDKNSSKTQELISVLKVLVNGIKVKKLGNPLLQGAEPYDLGVKFE